MRGLKNYAVILASGSGSRFGSNIAKQFLKIAGKTIFERSINIFENNKNIDYIVVVVCDAYYKSAQEIINHNGYKKIIKLVKGGSTRRESSEIGVNVIDDAEANVIIHDCARPLLSCEVLDSCIDALERYNAVAVGIVPTDTIWEIDNMGFIKSVPDRINYKMAQTPQCFKLSLIKKAHSIASQKEVYTDDCSLVLRNNLDKVFVIEGDVDNIKITYPKDLYLAESLLSNNIRME